MSRIMFAAKLPITRRVQRRKSIRTSAYYSFDMKNSKSLEKVEKNMAMFHILAFIDDGDLGVYSVTSQNDDDVSENCIIAFRTFEDAFRYKTLLEAEMHVPPYVQFASRFELEHMCAIGNYKCHVVDENALITPPTDTMKITDWERRSDLLNGRWTVKPK
jgi:hypothetical protein